MTTLPISPDAMPNGENAELSADDVLKTADSLRWQIGRNFHERLMEDIYTDAAQLADRAVTRPGEKPRFDLDRTIDWIVTSRVWGFPLMILLFTLVFWITISGCQCAVWVVSHTFAGYGASIFEGHFGQHWAAMVAGWFAAGWYLFGDGLGD